MKKILIISISLITILSCSMASIYSNKTQLFDLKSKLKNNLLGYWSFDNLELIDSSSYGNNGLNFGAVLDKGIIGNSIDFSRYGSFVTIKNKNIYQSHNKTIMFWFNKNTPTINETRNLTNIEGLIWKADDTGYNREFSFSISNDKYPFNIISQVGLQIDGIVESEYLNSIYPQKWYHVALVIELSKILFYMNGKLVQSNTITTPTILNQSDIYIGKASKNSLRSRYFNGKIDEFYIYKTSLTEDEINEFYRAGK